MHLERWKACWPEKMIFHYFCIRKIFNKENNINQSLYKNLGKLPRRDLVVHISTFHLSVFWFSWACLCLERFILCLQSFERIFFFPSAIFFESFCHFLLLFARIFPKWIAFFRWWLYRLCKKRKFIDRLFIENSNVPMIVAVPIEPFGLKRSLK